MIPPQSRFRLRPATVVMGDDPPIDDIVKKEAPKYATEKPKGGNGRPDARGRSHRGAAGTGSGGRREIDRLVNAKLKEAKISASPQADDAEFLRRVYVDITGCVPPVAKTPRVSRRYRRRQAEQTDRRAAGLARIRRSLLPILARAVGQARPGKQRPGFKRTTCTSNG